MPRASGPEFREKPIRAAEEIFAVRAWTAPGSVTS